MSMKREDASEILSDEEISCLIGKFYGAKEALDFALSALRPVSREQVEKVWRGCNECTSCKLCIWNETKKCNGYKNMYSFKPLSDFCPRCGKPLTDEAVEMVMERLEELSNGKG